MFEDETEDNSAGVEVELEGGSLFVVGVLWVEWFVLLLFVLLLLFVFVFVVIPPFIIMCVLEG